MGSNMRHIHRYLTVMCLGPATKYPNLQGSGITHVTFERRDLQEGQERDGFRELSRAGWII